MERRNLNKLNVFVDAFNSGEISYKDGSLFRTIKRFNQHKVQKLDTPELMRTLDKKNNRYYRVRIGKVTCYEHLVIYAIFHGVESMAEFETIDHIDGNKRNNDIGNLEGVSMDENNKRAKEKGLLKDQRGSNNGASILSDQDVLLIKELYGSGEYTQSRLAEMYNVTQSAVSNIVRGKRWAKA